MMEDAETVLERLGERQKLEKLQKQRLATAVFEQLLARIVDGTFRRGQPMPSERLLCNQLGVSRTAVREAMARLVELKLVAVRHGGQTLVLDYRKTGGLDLLPRLLVVDGQIAGSVAIAGLEMRAVIAPDIAKRAAERATRAFPILARAEAAVAAMANTKNLKVLQQLSLDFWAALVEAADNIAYQLAFNSLRAGMTILAERIAEEMADELRDLDGYRAILKAVKALDRRGAERAARAHIAIGMRTLERVGRGETYTEKFQRFERTQTRSRAT